jgi:radical SAM mobile pair protein B
MEVKEIKVKSVLSKSNLPIGDYSVNPYVGCRFACKYCYASFMKRFTNHPEPWGQFVDVKYWDDFDAEKYRGKELFFGSVTDPYQPVEAEFKRTQTLLKQLQGSGIHLNISTKSDLIVRDLDLIKSFPGSRVSWSINTLDEKFKRAMDKGASIRRRLDAMKAFYDAGVQTALFISPIFPGITDPIEIIEAGKDRCNLVWLENLNLRGEYKPVILNWIHENHPELDDLYHQIYVNKDRTYWQQLDEKIREYARENGFIYVRDDDSVRAPFGELPVINNYFYHEEVRKSAKKDK